MPTPIAKTAIKLRQWMIDYYDPEIAAALVVGPDGYIYDSEALVTCEACLATNLSTDTIVDGLCEPCRVSGQEEADHQRGLTQMVRRL